MVVGEGLYYLILEWYKEVVRDSPPPPAYMLRIDIDVNLFIFIIINLMLEVRGVIEVKTAIDVHDSEDSP